MPNILSGMHNLDQHLSAYLDHPLDYKPDHCPYCFSHCLWAHGTYERKAACENGRRCPIPIPRFLCVLCGRTCSTLPEYIPPKRWYHWAVQQMALSLLLMGNSLLSVWSALFDRQPCGPCQSTLQRWWIGLKHHYSHHRFHLCSALPALGYTARFTDFWQACLQQVPLSSAMIKFHRAGLAIP